MSGSKKKIVILGAGFGGVKAALVICQQLKRQNLLEKYEINLIDRNPYHTYTSTLYETATTSKDLANQVNLQYIITFPLKTIFHGKKVILIQKTVSGIDLINGDIHFQDSPSAEGLKFDYLVLALGSETNYFNIPGLKENSLALKTFKDAIRVRDSVWSLIEANQPGQEINIVVGGGGATGVELAGEIQSWLCQLTEELKHCSAKVKIIEAAGTILSGFHPVTVKKVTGRLKKIGVELLVNESIEKVEPQKILLKSKQVLPFDLLIWTGGVKAVNLMGALPLKKEQRGRVEVQGEMQCFPQTEDLKLYGKVYGLGDAICFYNPKTNKPIPLLAQAAIEQAKVAAYNIIEDIKFSEGLTKKLGFKKYFPREYPYIIPVGGKYAVAKIGPIILSGFLGWLLKGLVELRYLLLGILPPLEALKIWLKGLWIFTKNDRLG